jgi:hypothetical protein
MNGGLVVAVQADSVPVSKVPFVIKVLAFACVRGRAQNSAIVIAVVFTASLLCSSTRVRRAILNSEK